MVLGKHMFAMLLVEKFFKSFTPKEIANAKKSTEVLVALEVRSREEVDDMVNKAIKAGGKEPRALQDHGYMYGRSFEDIKGHIWEIFWMDITRFPKK